MIAAVLIAPREQRLGRSSRTAREIKAMMAEDGEFLRPMVRAVIQEFLEAEMAEAVGAEKRSEPRGD
jgi:transposase-like protein